MSEPHSSGFFAELRRRGVLRVLALYLAGAWVAIEVSATTFPRLGLPDWMVTALVWAAVFLLPIVAGAAWLFQVEDGRVRRDLRSTPRRARTVAATVGALTAVVGAGAWWAWLRPGAEPPTLPGMVAVLPFRTGGADPDLAYLREGMVDLLAPTLTGEVGPRGVDARTVVSAWRRTAGSVGTELPRDSALVVARAVGAGAAITGSLIGSTSRLTIHAELVDVEEGRVSASARVTGSPDSLQVLGERLVGILLSLDSGRDARDLAPLTENPPPLAATRGWLQGLAAYRRGEFESAVDRFRFALQIDSTFAPAAFGLELAAPWSIRTEERERGQRIAWRHRDRLSPLDQLHLASRSGPDYPEPPTLEDLLEVREQAVEVMPDRAEVWYELGDLYFHWGRVLGEEAWLELALEGFNKALELDPDFAAPIHHSMMVAAMRRDTAAVRALGSRLKGASAAYGRWLEAHVVGDTAGIRRMRSAYDTVPPELLVWIVGAADQSLGIPPEDARAAATILAEQPNSPTQKRTHLLTARAVELNAGRPVDALRWLDAYAEIADDPHHASRLAITDALYAGGDTARAEAAARRLESATSPDTVTELANRCLAAEWRLWHGQGLGDAALPERARAAAGDGRGFQNSQLAVCAGIVEALAAAPGPVRNAALDRLDTLLLRGPFTGFVDLGGPYYGNLALSRLREESGDLEEALAASRRLSHFHGEPGYTAEFRFQEARLAEQLGLDSAAVSAYRYYLNLRADPELARRAGVDSARARLEALQRARTTGSP